MWSYYGSKSKVVKYYPKPLYEIIIEPFAGSARYSLEYYDRKIYLIEKDKLLVQLWHWLQEASEQDILSLPEMESGENTDDFTFSCQEAKWLMGFMIQGGVNYPRKTVSSVGNFGKSIERDKKRIASNLFKIRHWKIKQGDYHEVNNVHATWFIDPPYFKGGEYYRQGNKNIDYKELSNWCQSRKGQIIVCENTNANWMDFKPLTERKMRGSIHSTVEALWYRENN